MSTSILINNIDTASERLQQARGVLSLIVNAGEGETEFAGLTHSTIMASLWAVAALIDQAQTSVNEMSAKSA